MTPHGPSIHQIQRRISGSTILNAGVLAILYMVLLSSARSATVVIDLKHGDIAPPIVLERATGGTFDSHRQDNKAHVILFGETSHEKTAQACLAISEALNEADMMDMPIQWLLVLSKASDPAEALQKTDDFRRPPFVLYDRDRTTFGDYGVVVLPSLVVVDSSGKVVHSIAGFLPRFADIASDAMRVSVGRLTYDEFLNRLELPGEAEVSHDVLRAGRLIKLAEQLSARDMYSMAIAKYREALELTPDSIPARIGLGEVYLRQEAQAEAAEQFRGVLALEPESLDATLGLATALAFGSEDDRTRAVTMAGEVLVKDPKNARAKYVMGLVSEQRGQMEQAAQQYRTAVELLFREKQMTTHAVASNPH